MKPVSLSFRTLQLLAWSIVYLFLLAYSMHKWEAWQSGAAGATIYTLFYLVVVYANSHFLLPRYFQPGHYRRYAAGAFLLLGIAVPLRMGVERFVLYEHLGHHAFYGWNFGHFSFVFVTLFLAFLFGFLLRIGLDYPGLLRQREQLRALHQTAELNLLKAQVQPHFLFNTLNNIYYLAYTRSERTAETVARLSELMRYFVDEAPNERVPLRTELQFLRNYIDLEQIRMTHPAQVSLRVDGTDEDAPLPPMLLIPFVENAFKHGVDKTRPDNALEIRLIFRENRLEFSVVNGVVEAEDGPWRGLENLRKRLEMLFPGTHELRVYREADRFVSHLSFPLETSPARPIAVDLPTETLVAMP